MAKNIDFAFRDNDQSWLDNDINIVHHHKQRAMIYIFEHFLPGLKLGSHGG